jgi:tetratricopeptide (TPR) repeat protein
MDEVIAKNPTNPEAWGRKAQLLYQQKRFDESEAALQKAFEQNPRYGFGHYLQGMFRHIEGEIAGALILFRRAADCYSVESTAILADIYRHIFECEFKLGRPVAARAAMELAVRFEPTNENVREAFKQLFGDQSTLPPVARQAYVFLPVADTASPERKEAWEKALASKNQLGDAARAFRALTEQDPADLAAWYNLAISLAWLGENGPALEAIDKYLALEKSEDRAVSAGALAELLRCGQGMEDLADIVDNTAVFLIKHVEPLSRLINALENEHRLVGAEMAEEDQTLTALVLEKPAFSLTSAKNSYLGASLTYANGMVILRNTCKQKLDPVVAEFRQALEPVMVHHMESRGPARFNELFTEATLFPLDAMDQTQAVNRVREGLERFYEQTWLNRPLKSLGGIPPVDAAGHPILRTKLLGVILFLEQCAGHLPYDFNRLRRKLGLMEGAAPGAAATGSDNEDIAAMSVAELAQLPAETLAVERLERAYQAALHLDAKELAGKFAKLLVAQPARPDHPDRWIWFNHLMQISQTAGDFDLALQYVDEGEKDDCEHNQGQRRNDYELRRAQLQCKHGTYDDAQGTFDRLIARMPSELRYQGSAAEAMLSARQGQKALQYAEKGLAGARQQNNRDMEDYFRELVTAAQKQG